MKGKKLVLVLGLMTLIGITSHVIADSSDVTTRWIVPADTTLGISYPSGESLIEFNCAGKNFSYHPATGQDAASSALRVTNNGNTAVKIEFNWTADWPSGITDVNISVGDNTNATAFLFGSANETTKQTVDASVAIAGHQDFWFWTCGTNVEETAGVDRSLRVTTTNV